MTLQSEPDVLAVAENVFLTISCFGFHLYYSFYDIVKSIHNHLRSFKDFYWQIIEICTSAKCSGDDFSHFHEGGDFLKPIAQHQSSWFYVILCSVAMSA